MHSGPVWQKTLRKALVILGTGGLMLQVGSSCDPTVRTTVLGGFQQLATSLVTAVFQGLATTSSSTNTNTTTTGT